MKKIMFRLFTISLILSSPFTYAQEQYEETVAVEVKGLCNMCKKTIEKSGSIANAATTQWNKENHIASISFNPSKTSKSEILKRIAQAGYDNEEYIAADSDYDKLPSCCQYPRDHVNVSAIAKDSKNSMHVQTKASDTQSSKHVLSDLLDQYFNLKDALVQSDDKKAKLTAENLTKAILNTEYKQLSHEAQVAWDTNLTILESQTKIISGTNNLDKQRRAFASLSNSLSTIVKENSAPEITIYLQNCPMYDAGKGANWLSLTKTISNPYYGKQMLNCGNTVETINKL